MHHEVFFSVWFTWRCQSTFRLMKLVASRISLDNPDSCLTDPIFVSCVAILPCNLAKKILMVSAESEKNEIAFVNL